MAVVKKTKSGSGLDVREITTTLKSFETHTDEERLVKDFMLKVQDSLASHIKMHAVINAYVNGFCLYYVKFSIRVGGVLYSELLWIDTEEVKKDRDMYKSFTITTLARRFGTRLIMKEVNDEK